MPFEDLYWVFRKASSPFLFSFGYVPAKIPIKGKQFPIDRDGGFNLPLPILSADRSVPYCRRGIYFYTRQRRDYISLAPLFVNSQINILMKTISYPAAYSYLCLHSRKLWNSHLPYEPRFKTQIHTPIIRISYTLWSWYYRILLSWTQATFLTQTGRETGRRFLHKVSRRYTF